MSIRKRKVGIFLKSSQKASGDLGGYMFSGIKHAKEWLQQEYIKDAGYSISIKSYLERTCCGAPSGFKIIKNFTREEFLNLSDSDIESLMISKPTVTYE